MRSAGMGLRMMLFGNGLSLFVAALHARAAFAASLAQKPVLRHGAFGLRPPA